VKKRESHIVPNLTEEIRLSDYVTGIFKSIPFKKGMKKAIERGKVQVDGKVAKTSKYLKGGEEIVLFDLDEEINIPVFELNLEVLFEDDHLAIINKPPGLVVSGNKFQTSASTPTRFSYQRPVVNWKNSHNGYSTKQAI